MAHPAQEPVKRSRGARPGAPPRKSAEPPGMDRASAGQKFPRIRNALPAVLPD